jgi:hypothetical protein
VADANGMTGDDDLVVGQAITLPSISTSANTSSTFKPYNPNEIVGSTTPSLPATPPPPPSQAGCSGLAQIVIIAVIIVATVFTAGAAAVAMGAVASGTSAFVAGATVLAGEAGLSAAALGAAAIGGFVGSVAGQLTGDALGVSHGFSFNQALTAGLAAGLSAGIGGEISAAGKSGASILANSKGAMQPVGQALFGAGAYASQVGAAEITGQPEHFSWAGMAASAIASGLTAEAGLKSETLQKIGLGSDSPLGNLEGGLLSGGINREASLMLGDDHVSSWKSIGEDAFGNALGNAVIGGIKAYEATNAPNPGSVVVGHLTGPNGASGYQYQDGVQTFAVQEGSPDGSDTAAGFQEVSSSAGNGYDPNNPFSVWNQEGAGQMEQSGVDVNGSGGSVAVSAYGGGGGVSTSYSGMPLAGHVGTYVDYFVEPENSNPDASPTRSSDRLTLADPNSAAANNDEIVSMIQQEEANGAPPYNFSNYTQDDALSYLNDYSHLGYSSDVSTTNLTPITVVGTAAGNASDVAEYASEAGSFIEYSDMGLTAATKLLVLSTLNRAKYLQAENMKTVASARELDPLAEVFRASSRSGSIIAKALPFARSLGYVGVAANAVETVADAAAAPAGNVSITVARDTTNFATEGLAVAGGFEAGAAIAGGLFVWTGPFDAVPIAIGGLLGAGIAAYEYNNYNIGDQVKNGVGYVVNQSVKFIDSIPDDYRDFKNNVSETVNFINQTILRAEHPWGR